MQFLFIAITRLHPLQRLALAAWVVMIAGVAGRVAFGPLHAQSVVPIYLNAAERWTRGENVYAVQPPLDIYRYPPAITPAFVPLTWLPERVAEMAWRGFGVMVFLLGLQTWTRHGLPRPLTPAATGAVFALAALPVLPSLNNGQVNVLLAGLLLLGATAAARSRGVRCGVWLAVAAAVKLYPIAAALLVALAHPRRILPSLFLGCAILAAVPVLFRNAETVANEYRTFVHLMRFDDRTQGDPKRWPRDFLLVLRVWAVAPAPDVYRAVQLAVAAVMAGFVVLVARRTRNPRVVAPLALHLGCIWMTVFGPATETHTYTLLGPTAAAAIVFARPTRWRLGLALAGYGLLVSTTMRDMFPNGIAYQLLAPQPIGGLLILAVIVREALGVMRHEPDSLPVRKPVPVAA
jgi:hypothetical protein